MPMTDAALLSEIQADPAGLGYAPFVASKYDGGVLNLLNDRTRGFTVPQTAPWSAVLKWMAKNTYRSKLEDAANNIPAGNANRDVALAILDLIRGAAPGFDTTDTGTVDLFRAIVPPTQMPNLLALGNVPASRAEVLGGYGTKPTLTDVSRVLRGTT
jgi:hypothetical protein